jgi:PAS domain S-box-containing protein
MASPSLRSFALPNADNVSEAENVLAELAAVFVQGPLDFAGPSDDTTEHRTTGGAPNVEAMYRTLVEQLPAVVFMAYLERGIGEAYVSPRIEEALGFTQAEWLEDPVRWYQRIHPDDQQRWSIEAAEMLLTGKPLRSAYRVVARDGRVIWFHCEAKMVRRNDGKPWFIHGVGFDISELKSTEQALQDERSVLSGVLDTVSALVLVLDRGGRIVRINRACEQLSGYHSDELRGQRIWKLLPVREEAARFRQVLQRLGTRNKRRRYESDWISRDGERRRIAWSVTILDHVRAAPQIILTGIDITERKRMEEAILDISAREQRQIGQDLHDGLGQHLTGIAFLSKVLEQKLAGDRAEEAADARKIVGLVNEAINKTRELSRGLLPVVSTADGLMAALKHWANEVEDLFHISCHFDCPEPVLITDVAQATHLYHIAQEAVNNAIRHAHATHLVMSLGRQDGVGTLSIEDDGIGLPKSATDQIGLGLRIMNYRASMVGGSLELRRGASGGTLVSCRFPLRIEANP